MAETVQPPLAREIQADTEISTALNGIAVQMAGLRRDGLAQEQCRDLYARILVEMVNAAGIDMQGRTLFNPAANASGEVNTIAGELGTTPTGYRTKVFVSPYERLSAGASALIVQQSAEGQDNVLLVRSAKHPGQWTLPAGYMDPLPASQFTLPDRVSRETRSQQEEAQVAGRRLDVPVAQAPANSALPVTELPSTQDTAQSFVNEYRRLLKEQGWQSAYTHINDGDYMRSVLTRDGHMLPKQPASDANYDLNGKDNIRREAKEETGLDIEALERAGQARITSVATEVGLGAGGGKRPNFATPHYLIDLGRNGALPPLKPEDKEITDAVWVPLSSITRDAETGNYMVNAKNHPAMPLDVFVIPHLEQSLNTLLTQRMKEASGGRVESVSGLRALGQSWQGRMALENDQIAAAAVEEISTQPPDKLPSLTDISGQALMVVLPRAAGLIGRAQDGQKLPQNPMPRNLSAPWDQRLLGEMNPSADATRSI